MAPALPYTFCSLAVRPAVAREMMLTAIMRIGMAEKMTRVSSQPWMKALIREAEKMVMKKMNIPLVACSNISAKPDLSHAEKLFTIIECDFIISIVFSNSKLNIITGLMTG